MVNQYLATLIPAILLTVWTWFWAAEHNRSGDAESSDNLYGPWTARFVMLLASGLFGWNAKISYNKSKKDTKAKYLYYLQIFGAVSLFLWTNAWAFEWYGKLSHGVMIMVIWGLITVFSLAVSTGMLAVG